MTERENIEKKVRNLLYNSLRRALNHIIIEWDDVDKHQTPDEHTPELSFNGLRIYDSLPIYNGHQIVVLGIFKENPPNKIKIEGQTNDLPVIMEIAHNKDDDDIGRTEMILKLLLIKIIREWERDMDCLQEQLFSNKLSTICSRGDHDGLKSKIIKTGCKHNLLSKYSSFIATDKSKRSNASRDQIETVLIHSQVPHGYKCT